MMRTIDALFSKHTKQLYKHGDVIIRAGDTVHDVLYLKRGFVRMSFHDKNGDMLVLHIFKAGSYFPLTCVINQMPNRYVFEALTPVEIYRAPQEEFVNLISTRPELMKFFLTRILRGLSGVMERMEHLVLATAYEKTVLLLLYYGKNFSDGKTKGKFIVPLTHREIAGWIGTTRETASLQIEMLQKKKLLTYNGRNIVIPNSSLLQKEVTTGSEFV